ncbi:hypothetical protein Tco_0098227 [Tanacetum coccineum]
MTTTNRLRAMDERLGDIETDISRLVGDVNELTYVFLAHYHIDHTLYNGTPYAYVSNILDLEVQQGVNFMSSTPIYSPAPASSLTRLVCLVMPTQDVTSVYISMFAANKCVLKGNLSSATNYGVNTFGVMP